METIAVSEFMKLDEIHTSEVKRFMTADIIKQKTLSKVGDKVFFFEQVIIIKDDVPQIDVCLKMAELVEG